MEETSYKKKLGKGAVCPICGKPAEEGCIYGVNNKALRLLKGDHSWKMNIKSGFCGGEIIGECPLLKGSYVKCIRCSALS